MRARLSSEGQGDFLNRVAAAGGSYLTVAHLEKVGTGMHHYAIPVGEVRGLTEEQSRSWRKRFLRWIEAHTPGRDVLLTTPYARSSLGSHPTTCVVHSTVPRPLDEERGSQWVVARCLVS